MNPNPSAKVKGTTSSGDDNGDPRSGVFVVVDAESAVLDPADAQEPELLGVSSLNVADDNSAMKKTNKPTAAAAGEREHPTAAAVDMTSQERELFFVSKSLVAHENPEDVNHEMISVLDNLTDSPGNFEEDLLEGETILSSVEIYSGPKPFTYIGGIWFNVYKVLTCGLGPACGLAIDYCTMLRNGDAHRQRLALTSKGRLLLWTSTIQGRAHLCCCCIPCRCNCIDQDRNHSLISATTLKAYRVEDITFVQQLAENTTTCWPFQRLSLRIHFNKMPHFVDKLRFVQTEKYKISSIRSIVKHYISTVKTKIFGHSEAEEVIDFGASWGKNRRHLTYSMNTFTEYKNDIDRFCKTLAKHLKVKSVLSKKLGADNIKPSGVTDDPAESKSTNAAVPEFPLETVEGFIQSGLSPKEKVISVHPLVGGWRPENVMVPLYVGIATFFPFLLILISGANFGYVILLSVISWALTMFYQFVDAWTRMQMDTSLVITNERIIQISRSKPTAEIGGSLFRDSDSSSSESDSGDLRPFIVNWWPLSPGIKFGVITGNKTTIYGYLRLKGGTIALYPFQEGESLCEMLQVCITGIGYDAFKKSIQIFKNFTQVEGLKPVLDDMCYSRERNKEEKSDSGDSRDKSDSTDLALEEHSNTHFYKEKDRIDGISLEATLVDVSEPVNKRKHDFWLRDRCKEFFVEGEEECFYYKGDVEPSNCIRALTCGIHPGHEWNQILISNSRLWGGLMSTNSPFSFMPECYKTKNDFMLFWMPVQSVQGFEVNGEHKSKANWCAETLYPCCFRPRDSSSKLTVAGFGSFPFYAGNKKEACADTGYLNERENGDLSMLRSSMAHILEKAHNKDPTVVGKGGNTKKTLEGVMREKIEKALKREMKDQLSELGMKEQDIDNVFSNLSSTNLEDELNSEIPTDVEIGTVDVAEGIDSPDMDMDMDTFE